MSTAGRILWVDNDAFLVRPFRRALEVEGYQVTIAQTVSDAASLLTNGTYDLVIIDVMIPTTAKDEAEGYSLGVTDNGLMTGLVFYVRNRDLLLNRRIAVIVMTVRGDPDIADAFVAAGLPRRCFVTKYEVSDVNSFLEKIRFAIDAGTGQPRNC